MHSTKWSAITKQCNIKIILFHELTSKKENEQWTGNFQNNNKIRLVFTKEDKHKYKNK